MLARDTMGPQWRLGRLLLCLVALCCVLSLADTEKRVDVSRLSTAEIEEALQECPLVQQLSAQKRASAPAQDGWLPRLFAVLFPGSPATNALLATLYISGPPNFLLALCPPQINPDSLTLMVAFALGGIMGDTILHLMPEVFLGEDSPEEARFVLVEPKRNLVLGLAIIVGFMTFVAMDKTLRIATGGGGHDHGHDHVHEHEQSSSAASIDNDHDVAVASGHAKASKDQAKRRKSPSSETAPSTTAGRDQLAEPPIKMSAYLNMIADFTHNITDGIALSSSFYASPTLGATTTAAVFFHEIPHEVGDFALLIQSGFSKRRAMGAQFITAVGAFLGTCLGIAIQEHGKRQASMLQSTSTASRGIADTGLGGADLLLAWTAGTFLYVGTVAVVPDLLETGPNARLETIKTLKQFGAIAAGVGVMLAVSWT